MSYDIQDFIREALANGAPKEDVASALKQEGWPYDEINSSLAAFGEKVLVGLPVPRRKPYTSAKEGFFYLVMFLTLYISAINFGTLVFQFIDMAFPDDLNNYHDLSSMRFSVASLLVAFPLYFWLTIITQRSLTKIPTMRASKVRKWLIYFTLFIASTVIIGDFIALLVSLLGGELTIHFSLKFLTLFIIAGMVFGYYHWDLGQDEVRI
jgi:hypothetical protein